MMKFIDIDEAIKWLIERRNDNYSFEHFKNVCALAGNPQDSLFTIHVAGTDGKGSTVNYLCGLLMSQNLKVGTFTSPHYIKHQDRIRINNEYIDDETFLRILNDNLDFYIDNNLSMFEIDFLIMCEYLKEEKVDVAIIEVGLGGRLDSTNVINNTKLSIITTIGFDHMDRLGDTLAKICKEKCGIIKKESRVLIGDLSKECVEIVKEKCKEANSDLYRIKNYEIVDDNSFIFEGRKYSISTSAIYQFHNASLALSAYEIIKDDLNIDTDYERLSEGLKNCLWHCRYEFVKRNPNIILDGAHNIHGISALVESFDKLSGSKCIIFSALKRKEYLKMIEILNKHCNKLIITTFDNPGTIDLKELKEYDTDADYKQAIDKARKEYDNILICGSLYFLSDVVLNYKF